MMSLEKEISAAKFNRFGRVVYAVHSSDGGLGAYFLTLDSAYQRMERIKHSLEFIVGHLERCDLHDLDCRPVRLVSGAGAVYELCTIPLEY